MAHTYYNGQLNQAWEYSNLWNMIIGLQLFDLVSDGNELVDEAKEEGTMYGDTKLFLAADVLRSHAYPDVGDGASGGNILEVNYNDNVDIQPIVMNVFRQIGLTLDSILSKQAFQGEGQFALFNDLMESLIGKTKRIYDVTTYNAHLGTEEVAAQNLTVAANLEDEKFGQFVAEKVANIIADLTKATRKYNELGYMTKFAKPEIKVIYAQDKVNKIRAFDLPVLYGPDEVKPKGKEIHQDYLGIRITTSNIATYTGSGKVIKADYTYDNTKGTLRALDELTFKVGATEYHYFPGEEIVASGATFKAGGTVEPGQFYLEDPTIVAKIFVKLPVLMSGFELGTSFVNPKSHRTNRWLTWGRNELKHFVAYPCITLRRTAGTTYAKPVIVTNDETQAIPTTEV